MAAYSVYTVQL